jgi:hypothetical protein
MTLGADNRNKFISRGGGVTLCNGQQQLISLGCASASACRKIVESIRSESDNRLLITLAKGAQHRFKATVAGVFC